MNTNEAIHNRNAEPAPRLRFNNDPIIQNIVYPYTTYPMHQLFYPISQPVIMTTNHSQMPSINANDQSSEQSGIMSPSSSDTSVIQPPYRISAWQDIVDSYEGNEEKPKCGKLKDNVYFTQRSASSDMYMLFDRKSDYINNFVNYYFSDKNLARDHKLVALMDDKGVVPLSALAKFPKLHQIDTTVEDLIKAFQNNQFVAAVDMQNSEKGAQRRDKLCSADVVNRNGVLEKSSGVFSDIISSQDINTIISNNSSNTTVADMHMTIANESVAGQQQHQQQQQQNQSYYVYNQAALLPTLYSPQAGIMPATSSLTASLPSPYNPYIMTANFPYATSAGSVGIGQSQSHPLYQSPIVWPVGAASDYGGHAQLLSQLQQQQQQSSQPSLPYSHHHNNGSSSAGNARFLSNSSSASSVAVNGGFNPVQTVVAGSAIVSEPTAATNRMN